MIENLASMWKNRNRKSWSEDMGADKEEFAYGGSQGLYSRGRRPSSQSEFPTHYPRKETERKVEAEEGKYPEAHAKDVEERIRQHAARVRAEEMVISRREKEFIGCHMRICGEMVHIQWKKRGWYWRPHAYHGHRERKAHGPYLDRVTAIKAAALELHRRKNGAVQEKPLDNRQQVG